jgi:hypothetical protein
MFYTETRVRSRIATIAALSEASGELNISLFFVPPHSADCQYSSEALTANLFDKVKRLIKGHLVMGTSPGYHAWRPGAFEILYYMSPYHHSNVRCSRYGERVRASQPDDIHAEMTTEHGRKCVMFVHASGL